MAGLANKIEISQDISAEAKAIHNDLKAVLSSNEDANEEDIYSAISELLVGVVTARNSPVIWKTVLYWVTSNIEDKIEELI